MNDKQPRIWCRLESEVNWRELEGLVAGFHDGVIKEMHWLHGEYVNRSLEMVYAGKPSLWMLIQLQLSETPAVEIRFHGVSECSVSAARELEPTVNFERDSIALALSSDGHDRVVAERCEYRLGGLELLGPGTFWSASD